jgi:hypothetical protein
LAHGSARGSAHRSARGSPRPHAARAARLSAWFGAASHAGVADPRRTARCAARCVARCAARYATPRGSAHGSTTRLAPAAWRAAWRSTSSSVPSGSGEPCGAALVGLAADNEPAPAGTRCAARRAARSLLLKKVEQAHRCAVCNGGGVRGGPERAYRRRARQARPPSASGRRPRRPLSIFMDLRWRSSRRRRHNAAPTPASSAAKIGERLAPWLGCPVRMRACASGAVGAHARTAKPNRRQHVVRPTS